MYSWTHVHMYSFYSYTLCTHKLTFIYSMYSWTHVLMYSLYLYTQCTHGLMYVLIVLIWVNSARTGILKHSCSFLSLLWEEKNHTYKNNLNLKKFKKLLITLPRVNGENLKLKIIFKLFRKSENLLEIFFSHFFLSILKSNLDILKNIYYF